VRDNFQGRGKFTSRANFGIFSVYNNNIRFNNKIDDINRGGNR
jgi:hypothetical protein